MFTVTMNRSLSILSVAAAVAVASTSASAQVIISTDGSGNIRGSVGSVVRQAITVSDDSIRSYLTRFEPGVLDDESGDANIVTMVLDKDGTYIRSTTRHAKMIQAVPGRVISVNGDSVSAIATGGGARVITINGDSTRAMEVRMSDVPVITSSGSAIAVNTLRRADGGDARGMLGGYSADEIAGIATKHYAAGEMGKGTVLVTLIYLK
jgi:hypothetical protein